MKLSDNEITSFGSPGGNTLQWGTGRIQHLTRWPIYDHGRTTCGQQRDWREQPTHNWLLKWANSSHVCGLMKDDTEFEQFSALRVTFVRCSENCLVCHSLYFLCDVYTDSRVLVVRL